MNHFPMRPQPGPRLTPANVLAKVAELRKTCIVQGKLNGDRVVLEKRNGHVEAWSRHGTRYAFNCRAASEWADLPDGTILDGEAWQGHFWPFEAIIENAPVEVRVEEAKRLCLAMGRPWLFDAPSDAWLARCGENGPEWEGIVAKERGSLYEWLDKPGFQSWAWVKAKWG